MYVRDRAKLTLLCPDRVNHSKNAIVKPQGKTPEMAQKEVDEAMKKVREATMAIATVIDPSERKEKEREGGRELLYILILFFAFRCCGYRF